MILMIRALIDNLKHLNSEEMHKAVIFKMWSYTSIV